LIIIERNDWVGEWITGGIALEGQPTPEIIRSVFQKESPLHDGAMIIRKGGIVATACYLPLSSKECRIPGEYYHMMICCNHREDIFLTDKDRFPSTFPDKQPRWSFRR
jgi:hypothetical protein